MTFLDPVTGLLAAAIAIPALLALYFLKLRRRPLRVSSTLLWEQAVRDLQVNVPFRWLRITPLLLLQLAALAAFLLALARPAIPGPAPVADRIVIIIDHSASMSARLSSEDESPADRALRTRLDRAKRLARDYAATLARSSGRSGGRPQVQVIQSAAAARIVCPFTSDSRQIEEAIESIGPTDQPGGPGAALNLLSAAESPDESGPARAEAVVFTDGPLAAGSPRSTFPPDRARPVIIGRAPDEPPNAGLVTLAARRDALKPEVIRIFARAQRTGEIGLDSAMSARLLVDGTLIEVRRAELARSSESATVSEASFTFEVTRPDACTVTIALDVPASDPLNSDNAAAVYLEAAAAPSILIVAPPAENGTTPEPDGFLLGALQALRPRAVRTMTLAAYRNEVRAARDDRREPFNASGINVIVFDRTTPDEPPSHPSLTFGEGLPVAGLELTPEPSRSSASPGEVGELTSTSPRAVRFSTWVRSHPLMQYVALDPIIISPAPRGIQSAPKDPAPSNSTLRITPLAFAPTATQREGVIIAAAEQSFGSGASGQSTARIRHIVVSFPLRRSNWGPDTSFPVFVANAIDLLTGLGQAAVGIQYSTAEPVIAEPISVGGGADRIVVTGPAGFQRRPDPGSTPADPLSPVNLGLLETAGVYTLDGARPPIACVNLLSSGESLAFGPLPNAQDPTGREAPAESASDSVRTTARPGQREVWHWFLIGAIALATVEWIIYGRGVRG